MFPELDAFEERFVDLRLGADEEEETPYLGLEDDDEGNETYADDGREDGTEETHAEEVGGAPGDKQNDECPENEDDIGAFDDAVDVVHQGGDKDDVDDVDDFDGRQAEEGERYHCLIV